jgi:SAM-dependent methyltransferase
MKQFKADYYDEEYFQPHNRKSSYIYPFTWEVEREGCMACAKTIIEHFNPSNVLELGCAKGFLLKALKELKPDIEVVGCDISRFALENLIEPFPVFLCDVRDGIPVKSQSFDVVVATNLLEHIDHEYVAGVIAELRRVSRRWVFVSMPISLQNANLLHLGDQSHVSVLPLSYWICQFYRHGFLLDIRSYFFSYFFSATEVRSNAELTFFWEPSPPLPREATT